MVSSFEPTRAVVGRLPAVEIGGPSPPLSSTVAPTATVLVVVLLLHPEPAEVEGVLHAPAAGPAALATRAAAPTLAAAAAAAADLVAEVERLQDGLPEPDWDDCHDRVSACEMECTAIDIHARGVEVEWWVWVCFVVFD